jgi:hypothetical protein
MAKRLLALGFFGRGNLGDQVYPLVLQCKLSNFEVTCACTDDISEVPPGTDAILVGGGDVVNPFFMRKVSRLLAAFVGPAYLISVGIPYNGPDLRFLRLFDHVCVRTTTDYQVARQVLPACDVTCYRDMAWSLPAPVPLPRLNEGRVVGLTLAQPYFANNQAADAMLDAMAQVVLGILHQQPTTNTRVLLIAFNTNMAAADECDIYINRRLSERLNLPNVHSIEDVTDPEQMLQLVGSLDLLVAMRLHSIIFATMCRTPFVCMYTTQKVHNTLQDAGAASFGLRLPVDHKYKPLGIDPAAVLGLVARRQAPSLSDCPEHVPYVPITDWQAVSALIGERKRRAPLRDVVVPVLQTFDDGCSKARSLLMKYTGMDDLTYAAWFDGRINIADTIDTSTVSLLEACRLICYALTQSTSSPCLWGLLENCQTQPGFKLAEAMRYIHSDHLNRTLSAMKEEVCELPPDLTDALVDFTPRHFVDVTTQDLHEFADVHRSGWPYVVKGLMTFNARSNFAHPSVLVDTYVDRTFHWGRIALEQEGCIPYTRPWVGFVHHTFVIDHGPYNCNAMFAQPAFLNSLPHCRCLIALSEYLAADLRHALEYVGHGNVPVEVLMHPTESVPASACFSMDKLLANPAPKLVQVGSWLRSAYAMYKMPFLAKQEVNLHRCILKTKECSNYTKPPCVEDALQRMEQEAHSLRDKNFPQVCNFYVKELIEHLREQEDAVELIERLTDDEYDALLSENVIFLRLVDCSACNTILEVIMRNGIVICNRHPAATEYLGPDYPGFYDTLAEAAAIGSSLAKLAACYQYTKAIDKARFGMRAFLEGFQKILDQHCPADVPTTLT